MNLEEFVCLPPQSLPDSGTTTWQAPSNIALVKYWGKTGLQLPANPSVSFTLQQCRTQTQVNYRRNEKAKDLPEVSVFFEGKPAPEFIPKIKTFLGHAVVLQPFLRDYSFEIHTSNTFPHSSGIASSASGMAALACCFMDMEKQLFPYSSPEYFNRKASLLARLGSGSAARSIAGGLVLWGQHPDLNQSSDLYGIPFPGAIDSVFTTYQDTVLLVDKRQKTVSSTVGHGLMKNHPFAKSRFTQARKNLENLSSIFESGDLPAFMDLVETEALSLHAMMMTSTPSYVLMKPETLSVIGRIREFRAETGVPVSFTLDAGANVHVLYPEFVADSVYSFISDQLLEYCVNGEHIRDYVGSGASKIQ